MIKYIFSILTKMYFYLGYFKYILMLILIAAATVGKIFKASLLLVVFHNWSNITFTQVKYLRAPRLSVHHVYHVHRGQHANVH